MTGEPVSVYRFFNSSTGAHLYTIDENEKEYIIDNLDNFNFEGEKFLAYQEDIVSTIPIYRFYEPIGFTNQASEFIFILPVKQRKILLKLIYLTTTLKVLLTMPTL
ncbi:MAG: hypothetical protein QNJ72_17615 [Pleurocapsa sp. MO_226.B13]|nr:hypothetical protein [Pleurocapsa sp. MO_226.B13]